MQFSEKTVTEIMTPRSDIVSLSKSATLHDVTSILIDSGYSRVPVYEDAVDHTFGFIYAKDMLPYLHTGKNFHWHNIIRPDIVLVPEFQNIHDLLRTFQHERTHIAMVVDEYGSITGLVTLEDIMEEIIGDIRDETDDATDANVRPLGDGAWMMDGKILLNDMCRALDTDTTVFNELSESAETLGGLLTEIQGEIPRRGVTLDAGDYTFTVRSADSRRIKKVLVKKKQHVTE
jgi:CBS domain containing-hemolysin-like protein